MKKFLPLFILLFSAQLLGSCADSSDKDGDEELTPKVTIDSELIAGMPADIYVSVYEQEYTLFFNDTPMEVKTGNNGPYIDIPADMKGPYDIYVLTEGVKHKVYATAVYKFVADCYPGVAFKADLSGANTVYAINEKELDNTNRLAYKTFKFGGGTEPSEIKFANSQGREVPAGFVFMKDISPDFFYATMWNISESKDIAFDPETYTCDVARNITQTAVVVDKKSGVITRIVPKNNDIYFDMNVSVQWMGDRTFCVLPDIYGAEFSTKKLYKFTIPQFFTEGNDKATDERFSYDTWAEQLPGLDNTDILNSTALHWTAASESSVFVNKERMLNGGSLSSISITSYNTRLNHPVFCEYATGGLSYIIQHADTGQTPWLEVRPLTTSGQWLNIDNCSCDHLVYQYADHTFLKAQATAVGKKIHDITITKDKIEPTTITATIADEGTISDIWENAITRYPCYSSYEYYVPGDGKTLIRRKIAAHDAPETVHTISGESWFNMASASANAISFATFSGQQYKLYEANGTGSIVKEISLDPKLELLGICRIKD